MDDVMLDLETLGTAPGSVILSIGAVEFDHMTKKTGREFYTLVNTGSCEAVGLKADADTLKWWEEQTAEAREVLFTASNASVGIRSALQAFNEFIEKCGEPKSVRVWGNGSDFDNALISAAFRATGIRPLWRYSNNRCFRTLKGIEPKIAESIAFDGVKHNALADAKHQALVAIATLRYLSM